MSIKKNDNKYSEKLKNHPIFQNQILRSDDEIKKMFNATHKFCKELIQGDILNELECYEEDYDICENSDSIEKDTDHQQKSQTPYASNNEKSCCQKTDHCKKITNIEDEEEDLNEYNDAETDFEDNKSQYALLLSCMRLYKIFEHILLKKYIYELMVKNIVQDLDNFEKAIEFFKNKKIIINEEEEQAIYLLQHLSDSIENSFLYQNDLEIDYSMLTEDEYMTSNIDPTFLFKTIEIAKSIVERIYNI